MATAHGGYRLGLAEKLHVRRTRGMVTGFGLVLLGVWGGIIPFIGPIFDYAYVPAEAWEFTMGRLWLEILPGIAAVIAGLCLLGSANRAVITAAGWLATAAGAWFVVGIPLSMLWNGGASVVGEPAAAAGTTHAVVTEIGFFSGLGVVIVLLAAFAMGRVSVLGAADLRRPAHEEPLE